LASILDGRVEKPLLSLTAAGIDDDGQWRCMTCLRIVDATRVGMISSSSTRGRIFPGKWVTGYELVCCGATA